MQKIVSLIIAFAFTVTTVYAESLNKTISKLGINKSAISVSVKNMKDGNVVYSLNDRVPRLPASTLKLVTSSAAYNQLGEDFKYETLLYKSTNNDLYLKLSGDPLLTTSDLETLLDTANDKNIIPKKFYIDDTAFDTVEWGEGWQWDDELNPLMQKFSVYNINNNLSKIEVVPQSKGAAAKITIKPFYPFVFINMVTSNVKGVDRVKFAKDDTISPNTLRVEGSVSKLTTVSLPVFSPKMNFKLRLEDAIRSRKFQYYDKFESAVLPKENIYLVEKVEHNLSDILPYIIKSSSNLYAETVFKTAGADYADSFGTSENSLEMLSQYIADMGLNAEDIKIVDGSGVSKNNIMTSKFMTEFLYIRGEDDDFERFKSFLTAPGEGTLKDRMLYFKENLRAKTGTLSEASAIAGYIITKRGNCFAFDIMINDAKTSSADKKNIEEQILRNVYLNY